MSRQLTAGHIAQMGQHLELIKHVQLPAVKAFSAKRCFVTRDTPEGVKLGWISFSFQQVFLNGVGHNEIDIPASELRVHRLRKRSKDETIIDALGGEEVAETYLAHMWEMMKIQGQGQQGDLLVNGYANMFYIRATNGKLWTVRCRWIARYGNWCVGARPIALPCWWSIGSQVFSS